MANGRTSPKNGRTSFLFYIRSLLYNFKVNFLSIIPEINIHKTFLLNSFLDASGKAAYGHFLFPENQSKLLINYKFFAYNYSTIFKIKRFYVSNFTCTVQLINRFKIVFK